ncbi:MAG: molybdopterin-dependent oxidoreductase, partial [Dehalococcoidia bacterium]|nr:molybdopterin-dependent oxidoreductase [Dehalococcoidia bacterium]
AISGPVVMLLALKTGRPVKAVFSREEMFLDGRSDVPMVIYVKDGVKKDGTIVAREVKSILNAGAYPTSAINVTRNMTFEATSLYRIPNFRWDSYCVATNEPPPGPYRGFGGNQVSWAIDCVMETTSSKLGLDSVQYLRKNLLHEGETDALGEVLTNIGVHACLDKVVEWLGAGEESPQEHGPWRKGKGITVLGKTTAGGTTSVAAVKVYDDATIEVRHSAGEVGQGCNTVLAQIAAEEFGATMDKMKVVFTDSAFTPFDIGSIGNRDTFNTGNAVRLACQDAKRQLFEVASAKLGVPAANLTIRGRKIQAGDTSGKSINVNDLFVRGGFVPGRGEITGWGVYTNPVSREDPETGHGEKLVAAYAYGACGVEVAVNVETGEVKVLRVGQCHDMGQPVNPKLCEGQIEGGRVMGMGRALFEEMVVEKGACLNANLSDYKLASILEVPVGKAGKSMLAPCVPWPDGPYGAKGFGDSPVLAMAPAIASAIHHAIGIRLTELPMTREKVLAGLKALRGLTFFAQPRLY